MLKIANLIILFQKGSVILVWKNINFSRYHQLITIDFCRPLHVFDYDKLEGDIKIRYSKKEKSLLVWMMLSMSLTRMIIICDDKKF